MIDKKERPPEKSQSIGQSHEDKQQENSPVQNRSQVIFMYMVLLYNVDCLKQLYKLDVINS